MAILKAAVIAFGVLLIVASVILLCIGAFIGEGWPGIVTKILTASCGISAVIQAITWD